MKTATFDDLERAIQNKKPLPARARGALHVKLSKYGYARVTTYGAATEDDTTLFSVDVEFDVPPLDKGEITGKQIEALEAEKKAVLAEAHQTVRALDEAIQNLKALEWKPED